MNLRTPRPASKWSSSGLDPRIGSLMREGRIVLYAYVRGVYREGTAEHLTALLFGNH
jgi:hypothetical protein